MPVCQRAVVGLDACIVFEAILSFSFGLWRLIGEEGLSEPAHMIGIYSRFFFQRYDGVLFHSISTDSSAVVQGKSEVLLLANSGRSFSAYLFQMITRDCRVSYMYSMRLK